MDIISKDIDQNLIQRLEFHKKCEEDDIFKAKAVDLFKSDIISFFNLCLWTYDPRKSPSDIPFILYDFQEKYVEKINDYIINEKSLLVEKSRDMGVTWMTLGVFLYRWMFFDENYLIGSRKEDLVDKLGDIATLFERIRYMLSTMPKWLVPVCEIDFKNIKNYMKIFKKNQASITGESTNSEFSRQGRYKAILLDEFASWEVAEQAWTASGDTAPCKLVVSTPQGKHNTFARVRQSGKIEVETLLWKLHPDKTDAWYEKQKRERSDKDIAQELDINYTISAGEPFYRGFKRGIHTKPFEYMKDRQLLLGWDYGRIHPCCVITQLSSMGIWYILDCIFGSNVLIYDFGNRVKEYLNMNYPRMVVRNYGDPAGNQESDKSLRTSSQILSEIGFDIMSVPSNTSMTNYDARKAIIEGKIKTLINGSPSLMVNDTEQTQIVIEAFEGGYRYPSANKFGFFKDMPLKEGYYEHVMNSIEYIAVNIFNPLQQVTKGNKFDITGYEEEDDDDEDLKPHERYRRVIQGVR